MERTKYRYILPENIKHIPNEGFYTMEMIEYPTIGWRAVYYVSEENHSHCNARCPHTGEFGMFDREWTIYYEDQINKDDREAIDNLNKIDTTPQIISAPSMVYVFVGNQLNARFTFYNSEGLIYDRDRSLDHALILKRNYRPPLK